MGYSRLSRELIRAVRSFAGESLGTIYQQHLKRLREEWPGEETSNQAFASARAVSFHAMARDPRPRSVYVPDADVTKFCEEVELHPSDVVIANRYLEDEAPGGMYVHWPEPGNLSAFLVPYQKYLRSGPAYQEYLRNRDDDPKFEPSNPIVTVGGDAHIITEQMFSEMRTGPSHIVRNIALLMYMQAFPECVKDGVPPDADKQDRKRGGGKTIGAHPHIKADVRQAEVMPHLRRGHFRTLKSEKYTKKRGQVVYVRPTMVKGSAKHVVAC